MAAPLLCPPAGAGSYRRRQPERSLLYRVVAEVDDGTLRYEMKRRFSDGRHVLAFEPCELLLRLCALVPPRGFHMVRYAGVFAAHARGRYALTGRGMHDEAADPTPRGASIGAATAPSPASPAASGGPAPAAAPTETRPDGQGASGTPAARRSSKEAGQTLPPAAASRADPAAPDDPARERRLAWAVLMRRTWGLDVLACPRCAGRMELIAAVEDERIAARILAHLGLPVRAPPRGKPWRRQLRLDAPEQRGTEADGVDAPGYAE